MSSYPFNQRYSCFDMLGGDKEKKKKKPGCWANSVVKNVQRSVQELKCKLEEEEAAPRYNKNVSSVHSLVSKLSLQHILHKVP